jgi:hypothetical protein
MDCCLLRDAAGAARTIAIVEMSSALRFAVSAETPLPEDLATQPVSGSSQSLLLTLRQ